MKRLAIIGDTIEAWLAAARLVRIVKPMGGVVEVVPVGGADSDELPRVVSAFPDLRETHDALSFDERDLVRTCGGAFTLGFEIDGQVVAVAEYGAAIDNIAFLQHWLRVKAAGDVAAYDGFSLGAAMARLDRFVHPVGDPAKIESTFRYGYRFSRARYRDYLKRAALHYGAVQRGVFSGFDSHAGGVAKVQCTDGQVVQADLFIDASGHGALLSGEDGRASGSELKSQPVQAGPLGCARTWKIKGQRFWEASTPEMGERLEVAGTRPSARDAWVGNCVAIGRAAYRPRFFPGAELRLATAGVDELLNLLPVDATDRGERAEYNRRMGEVYGRLNDLADVLDPPEGRDISSELARRIEQFVSRGRVVTYDGDTLDRSGWTALLLAAGHKPRRCDPLANAQDVVAMRLRLKALADHVAKVANAMPDQRDYLRQANALMAGKV